MAKMRVHELAKELNIKSQDILDKLKNTKFDGKSASSNMEDEAQALIRGAFAKETKSAADAKNRHSCFNVLFPLMKSKDWCRKTSGWIGTSKEEIQHHSRI